MDEGGGGQKMSKKDNGGRGGGRRRGEARNNWEEEGSRGRERERDAEGHKESGSEASNPPRRGKNISCGIRQTYMDKRPHVCGNICIFLGNPAAPFVFHSTKLFKVQSVTKYNNGWSAKKFSSL